MIELERASRWYGQVIGINDVSCQIGPGITALLGPNGAGKSTMMKLVTGQLRPTTGTVKVLGQSPFNNSNVYRRLGYCPESESSYEDLTGTQMVTMLAWMAGISGSTIDKKVAEMIAHVGMSYAADRKIASYSKGMRQRIKIAQAMIHDPDVLLLDEPLNGLDPTARREVTSVLHGLAEQGKCVIVSSHILYEVEQMTQHIILMHRGRLMAQGDIYRIRSLIDSHPHRIAITSINSRRLAGILLEQTYVLSAKFDPSDDRKLEIETKQPEKFYALLPELVLDNGISVERFSSPDNNLEAVFKYLVEA